MRFALIVITSMLITACSSTESYSQSTQQLTRQQIQQGCSKQYAHIQDPMTKGSKIKACMRARGAL